MDQQKQEKQQERDWTNLPTGILDLILQRLDNTIPHRTRLRSVCSSWRTSVSPNNPLTPLPPFLTHTTFYLIYDTVNKTNAWLTRVSEALYNNNHNHWSLLNPMSPDTNFTPMPDIKGTTVSFLDNNVTQVATAYSVVGDDLDDVVKVVLLPTPKKDGVCLAALFHGGELKLWKAGYNEWTDVKKDGCRFEDVVVFKGEFYVTDANAQLMVVNPETFELRSVIESYMSPCTPVRVYLVVSCGKLYLVNKRLEPSGYTLVVPFAEACRMLGLPYTGPRIEPSGFKPKDLAVWVLTRGAGGAGVVWKPTWSLDDRLFFVSSYVTFSLSPKDLGFKRGDRIMFSDDALRGHDCDEYGGLKDCKSSDHTYTSPLQLFNEDCGVFDMHKRAIKFTTGFPLPCQFKIFWPVPKWLLSA